MPPVWQGWGGQHKGLSSGSTLPPAAAIKGYLPRTLAGPIQLAWLMALDSPLLLLLHGCL